MLFLSCLLLSLPDVGWDTNLLTGTCEGIYTYKYILIALDGVIKIILRVQICLKLFNEIGS
jgi:hypothetical protein